MSVAGLVVVILVGRGLALNAGDRKNVIIVMEQEKSQKKETQND